MLHPICHLYPCLPTMLLLSPSSFTLLLLHYQFIYKQQMCQNLDRLKNHEHYNISRILKWKISCTTSHMMQQPIYDGNAELYSGGKQVPCHIWHNVSHCVRHNSTFTCTYTLKHQRPDCYNSKFRTFTNCYIRGI